MRFLDFVEQHHGIGPATNGFSEHAAFAVTDIAWRRALQRRHGVRFWNSDMLMVIRLRSPP